MWISAFLQEVSDSSSRFVIKPEKQKKSGVTPSLPLKFISAPPSNIASTFSRSPRSAALDSSTTDGSSKKYDAESSALEQATVHKTQNNMIERNRIVTSPQRSLFILNLYYNYVAGNQVWRSVLCDNDGLDQRNSREGSRHVYTK